MAKPEFDPNKPFKSVEESKPEFDPNKPYSEAKPDSNAFTKAVDYIFKAPTVEGIKQASVETLPNTGSLVGETVGTVAGPVGRIVGGGIGGVVGTIAKTGVEDYQQGGLKQLLRPPTMSGIAEAAKMEGNAFLEGMGQVMGGQVIGKGLSRVGSIMSTGKKAASDAVLKAAERLGFKPTPGMTSASPVVQGLESSLAQSPSVAGHLVREKVDPVRQGLKAASEGVLESASGKSAFDTGMGVSKGVVGGIGEKYNRVQLAYEPFNKELPKMMPIPEDKWKMADQIAKAAKTDLSLNTNMDAFAQKVTNKIMDSRTLADVEEIRKQVAAATNAAYRSGDRNAVQTLSEIQDYMANFRDDQFVKLAQASGDKAAGNAMITEYQLARKQYANMMRDLEDVGPILGIRNKNPQAFVEAVQNIPPETLAKKLFNAKDYTSIQRVQQYFPEEFELVKNMKIGEIQQKSFSPTGEIDPAKLVKEVNKFSPEVQKVLFGANLQSIKDIQTIVRSLPAKMGPSGTPQGEMFNQSWNPMQQGFEALRYGKYRTMGSAPFQRAAETFQSVGGTIPGQAGLGFGAASIGPKPLSTDIKSKSEIERGR